MRFEIDAMDKAVVLRGTLILRTMSVGSTGNRGGSDMAFELYRFKGGKSRFGFPAITLQASGGIGLNDKAYEELETPAFVQLYYDEDAKRIGIMATAETDTYGYPVRESGESTFIISARSFYSYYGINPDETLRYRAEMDGEMLVADLKEPISPYRPRKKRQERPIEKPLPSDEVLASASREEISGS